MESRSGGGRGGRSGGAGEGLADNRQRGRVEKHLKPLGRTIGVLVDRLMASTRLSDGWDQVSALNESDPTAGDINVQRAFRLGWRFAQLYHDPHRATLEAGATEGRLPSHLPSLSELSAGNRTELILREIKHDVASIKPELSSGDDDPAALDLLLKVMRGPIDSEGKQTQILETFRHLRIQIGADDARLSTGIDLGRMLADTVLLARSSDAYLAEFKSYRLQNAYEWLEDLHTSFPANASDAVKGSLQYWEQWVANASAADLSSNDMHVRRALSLQGERWRRLLSGEILPEDLLAADDYRKAASNYLGRIARLTGGFVRRFWPAIILVLGGTGAIIWAILTYAPTGAASVAAVIATAIGSLGVSWKTVGSTLGKVATMAEQPLWNAEVLEAIVAATFIPPVEMNNRAIESLRKQIEGPKALPVQIPEHSKPETPSDANENAIGSQTSGEQPPDVPVSGEVSSGADTAEPGSPEK